MTKSCKTCAHLIVPPDALGRIVVRAKNVYGCKAPVPEPALPYSVTKAHDFRWPPSRSYVTASDGQNCPTWVERKKEINP